MNLELLKKQLRHSEDLYRLPAYQNEAMKRRIENIKTLMEVAMSQQYKNETGEFKGNKTFSIMKDYVNQDGETKEQRVMSFGLTKAKAILSQIEDIKKFVAENEKVDADNLPKELQDLAKSVTTNEG